MMGNGHGDGTEEHRIIPFRGEYYKIAPARQFLVKNLIYPVPDPTFPFLGVHFTRMAKGGVEAGPNAVFAYAREGYRHTDINLADLWRTVSFKGFWAITGNLAYVVLFTARSANRPSSAHCKNYCRKFARANPGARRCRGARPSRVGKRRLGRRFHHQAKPPYHPRPQCPLARRHRIPRHWPADLRDGRKEFRAHRADLEFICDPGAAPLRSSTIHPSFHWPGLNVSLKSATYLSKSSITCCSNGSNLYGFK